MMKTLATCGITAVVGLVGGFWLGYGFQNPPMASDTSTIINHGFGDFPKEAFIEVNDELDRKVDSICGPYASQGVMVVVIPDFDGYRVRMVGARNSPIWVGINKKIISEWISERMNQIQTKQWGEAEEGGTGQPATSPEPKSEGGDKPQPEAEGRTR